VPGGIDPNCIFVRYAEQNEDSDVLYVTLFFSEDDVVNISCKVVFVIKREDGNEYVGLSFHNLDDLTLSRIEEIIRKVSQHG